MKFVSVAAFNEPESAAVVRRKLEAAGCSVRTHDETKRQRFWYLSRPCAGFSVDVFEADYLRVRELLKEWDRTEPVMKNAIHCPMCQSTRVEYPQMTRKFVTPTLGILLMVLRIVPREFYCLDCQYTWPPKEPLQRPRDELGWPSDSKLWHPEQRRD